MKNDTTNEEQNGFFKDGEVRITLTASDFCKKSLCGLTWKSIVRQGFEMLEERKQFNLKINRLETELSESTEITAKLWKQLSTIREERREERENGEKAAKDALEILNRGL